MPGSGFSGSVIFFIIQSQNIYLLYFITLYQKTDMRSSAAFIQRISAGRTSHVKLFYN